jgi:predicted O-methyltransferase YrrM
VLFRLVRNIRPHTCIELGTSVGISASYQAAALKLNGFGTLVTLEGANPVDVAGRVFAGLSLDNVEVVRGRFQDTLHQVLALHRVVDYAFVDGHHDGPMTIQYFENLLPALSENAVVVFDDIKYSGPMKSAWNAIKRHERVRWSVDLASMGIVSVAGV